MKGRDGRMEAPGCLGMSGRDQNENTLDPDCRIEDLSPLPDRLLITLATDSNTDVATINDSFNSTGKRM